MARRVSAETKPAPSQERPGPRINPGSRSETVADPGAASPELPDRYVPWPSQQGEISPYVVPPLRFEVGQAESAWFDLPQDVKDYINRVASAMGRGKTGQGLWRDSVEASKYTSGTQQEKTPFDYINSVASSISAGEGAAAGGRAGGRGGAYTGPVRSVAVQAETDIVASARAAAEELLGRMPTQQELDRILKRTRSAEQAQPTVQTRQGPGQITTAEGLTKEGRDNILRQVLMQSPDYQDYQIDSTVMDMMLTNLRRGQEVARG